MQNNDELFSHFQKMCCSFLKHVGKPVLKLRTYDLSNKQYISSKHVYKMKT